MNIALIDDHRMFLEATAEALKRIESIHEVYTLNQLEVKKLSQVLNKEILDIVIIDINLNGVDGIHLAEKIRKEWPKIPIAFLTGHTNQLYFKERAVEFQADGFFTKNQPPDKFAQLIEEAIKGNKPGMLNEQSDSLKLTEDQLKVLKLLCQGYTHEEMSKQLFITTRQIERHKKKIFDKFQVTNEKGAIRKAIELGYIIIS
jgi:DNA-binding NarL/FixJ family response regulator